MSEPVKPAAAPEPAPKATGLALLRVPFEPHQIGKLPQPIARKEVMDSLDKAFCSVCHTYHAVDKIIHLDYVGHAAVTDRLLDADPTWFWEPLAIGLDGLPVFDKKGGLWIWLTVLGVRRIGYGSAEAKSWSASGAFEKEIIGDAIRNAAMRFGVALELWHKGELHKTDPTNAQPPQGEDDWPPQDGSTTAVTERVERGRPQRRSAAAPATKPAAKAAPQRAGQFALLGQVRYLRQQVKALKVTDAQLQAMLNRFKVNGLDDEAQIPLATWADMKAELEALRDA